MSPSTSTLGRISPPTYASIGVRPVINASGTYKMDKSNCCYKYVRFTLVTDSVGGAVTLAVKLMAGLS